MRRFLIDRSDADIVYRFTNNSLHITLESVDAVLSTVEAWRWFNKQCTL